MFNLLKIIASLGLASSLINTAYAHTWIEQMQVIADNGSYVGNYGYSRGYMSRNEVAEGYNGYSDLWQIPSPQTAVGRTRINGSDFACHPAQRTANYSSAYPKLQVAPDSYVAMKYLENGHVTQTWIPSGKPDHSGTVFVYGTYQPADDEKLLDVLQWNQQGTGGNGKGWLMTTQDYDDGRCHQLNAAPISVDRQEQFPDRVPEQPLSNVEQWCETDLHIPANTTVGGTLTTYWVWSWQTADQTEGVMCGKDEYYTTCSDFDIVGGSDAKQKLAVAPKVNTLVQMDPQSTAVSNWKSRTAAVTTPNIVTNDSCTYSVATSSSLPFTLTHSTTLNTASWTISTSVSASSLPSATPIPSATMTSAYSSSSAAAPSSSMIPAASYSPAAPAVLPVSEQTQTVTVTIMPVVTATLTAASTSSTNIPMDVVGNSKGYVSEVADQERARRHYRRHARHF